MKTEKKESALVDFMRMIYSSWTWQKMTKSEQNRFEENIDYWYTATVKGTYRQRWDSLQAIYNIYLIGLGYDGFSWREAVTAWH